MALVRKDQFTGSNNIAKPERLPEGAVVDAVNMDFTVGGKAEVRAGYSLLREAQQGHEYRALFAMPDSSIAVVEDNNLIKLKNGTEQIIANIPSGPVAATLHNNKLYINTQSNSLEIDAFDSVGTWHERNPEFNVNATYGQLKKGSYKVGVTKLINGKESGSNVFVLPVNSGGIHIALLEQGQHRIYCSTANGSTLYYQGEASNEYKIMIPPIDSSARLETALLSPFPFCEILDSHHGRIVGASGRFLYYSRPMQPHLHHPAEDYLQFPSDITVIATVAGGIYVCADKTYFISGIGSSGMVQRVVLEFGAVKGTSVRLPNTHVAWFTKYGQVVAGASGELSQLNKGTYLPAVTKEGSAGFIEHNGNEMITTTMRSEPQASQLNSTDYWDIEVS